MFRAVIFDMDGVIIDSEPLHCETDRRVLSNYNIDASTVNLDKYVGKVNYDIWAELKNMYNISESIENILHLRAEYNMDMIREYKDGAIPGVRELLMELKSRNILTAIASSSSLDFINAVVDKLCLREYFDIIISGEEVQKGKPAPDVFLKAAEMLNVKPCECVVIEDSTNGVRAAISAGMKCIGFRNINSGSHDLSSAQRVVDAMSDVNYGMIRELFD